MKYIVKRVWYVEADDITEAIKVSKNWNHASIFVEHVGVLNFKRNDING